MIALVQRVRRASVREADGAPLGSIGRGLVAFICAEIGDGAEEAAWMSKKLAALRIFDDDAGKMNLDCRQAGGAMLLVSQFTLAADTSRGHRPSFIGAAPPEVAEPLVEDVVRGLRALGVQVETGRFRAAMEVELVNEGPVTIWLQSARSSSKG